MFDGFIKTTWAELKIQASTKRMRWFYITVGSDYEVYVANPYYSLVAFLGPLEVAQKADFEANYKASSTQVPTRIELEVKIREPLAPTLLFAANKQPIGTTTDNRLKVQDAPPEPPVGATPVHDQAVGVIASGTYRNYSIPVGEILTVQRFIAGCAGEGNRGARIILQYDQPTGDPIQNLEIARLYVRTSTHYLPLNFTAPRPAVAGDRIRIHRLPLEGSIQEVYGRWEGYY